VGVGIAALHFFVVVYVARHLASATRLYGTLGSAAALLSFLYLIGRLVVASAAQCQPVGSPPRRCHSALARISTRLRSARG